MMFRQMKYFVAVVDCNSFTEAAEQCCISQSAVSQQIRSLERELSVELLHRENHRFSMTPAGEHFYRHSKRILEEVELLCRETMQIGQDEELQLRIGYLRCYSGMELNQAVADFLHIYSEVSINIVIGTHEELYDLLRMGDVNLIISDQRRAFSDEYENFQLVQCNCYAELSVHNRLSLQKYVTLEDLRQLPCILVAPNEQQKIEQDYYKDTLGFAGSFLFAENLEEGRLMAVGNRGFMPVENVGTLPPEGQTIRRLPIYRGNSPLSRNYCAFWKKSQSNYYIEELAELFRHLIQSVSQ